MVLLPLGVAMPILQIRTSRIVEIEVVKSKSSSVLWHRHAVVKLKLRSKSRNRPPEELDNKRSSTRRGEFDSSTPEVIGVLLG